MISQTLAVAVGSAVGGVLRFWLTNWMARLVPNHVPLGTMVVNVTGSFAIGVVAAALLNRSHPGASTIWPALLMTGLLGGFTTFSAFSLQTLLLLHEGRWVDAGANVALSVLLCLAAVWLGWQIGMLHQG